MKHLMLYEDWCATGKLDATSYPINEDWISDAAHFIGDVTAAVADVTVPGPGSISWANPVKATISKAADKGGNAIAVKNGAGKVFNYKIIGVETTLDFCKFVLNHDAFVSGNFDTGFVNAYFTPEVLNTKDEELEQIAAIAGSILFNNKNETATIASENPVKKSKWRINRLN